MHRWFYSIGVFLFLCLFSFAGYNYQQVNVLRAQVQEMQKEMENEPEISGESESVVETTTEEGGYYLVEEGGVVSVYQADRTTLYETTGISMDILPEKLQEEIKDGKYVKSELELYSFLENYSS